MGHIFGKYKVGFPEEIRYGGLQNENGVCYWWRVNVVEPYSIDPYGLQEE